MRPRKLSNSECRIPGSSPEAWEEKRTKDERKDKHTWHCGDGLLHWSEASGVGSILIGGATQKETGFAAAEFCRGCGPGTTQSSSHLADGVEVAGRQWSHDRDKGNSTEVANKVKDLHTHSKASAVRPGEGVAAVLEEKKQECDEP